MTPAMGDHPATGNGRLVQATCVLVGRAAVLIRGAPGTGKSTLALALLDLADARRCVRLVADDAVTVRASGGRLVASTPAAIRGLIELRTVGPVALVHEDRAVVAAVVDLAAPAGVERLPDPESAEIIGIPLPRLVLPARDGLNARRVAAWFDRLPLWSLGAVREPRPARLPQHSIRA